MKWYIGAWKKYADFQGRAHREEFWMFTLFNLIALFVLFFLNFIPILGQVLFFGYCLAVMVPALAVVVRRMHDAGKSGWFYLVPVYRFILLVTDSEPGENKWGPNPKEVEAGTAAAGLGNADDTLDGHLTSGNE